MELDNLDMKILAYLDNNARTPNTVIAKRLKVNKNVVNYRIRNMEKSELIQGYHTLINSYKLGYQGYRLYVKFQYLTPEKEREILNYFVNEKNTWLVGQSKGSWDLAVLFWVKNQTQLVDTIQKFMDIYRVHIFNHLLVVYYGIGHYRYPFTKKYLKNKSNFNYLTLGKEVKTDAVDHKLLRFLSTNARASFIQIAKKLKLSPGAVRYRMKNLIQNKIISGFRATIDSKKLGYSLYKININVDDRSIISKIYKFAKEHDNIFYMNNSLGYRDAEVEVQARDSRQFSVVLDELLKEFSGKIKNYDFFVVDKFSKSQYMPDL